MKKKAVSLCLASVVSAAIVFAAAACGETLTYDYEAPALENADATLTLSGKTDKKVATNEISDTLFGVFLEDINYASYALDDNLLCNYSFEYDSNKTIRWSASSSGVEIAVQSGSDGPLGELYEDYTGSYVNSNYAKVSVTSGGGSIYNAGYSDPVMAVEEGVDYVFSAFIKTATAQTITLRVTDGTTVYAEGTVALSSSSSWVKYQKTITASATGTSGLKFEIAFDTDSTVYLDAVKLETCDSTLGIKNYIYEAIADLSPKFIRFPGGCVIEGTSMQNAYDWKNSIGAVASTSTGDTVPAFTYTLNDNGETSTVTTYGEQITRKANTDIWVGSSYYEMEYGLGFYDYMLLCDELGASPVPVINCGLSDMGGLSGGTYGPLDGRHGNQIEDYIQDAKDLICFANGSVNSSDENEAYWAQVRTNMGHPEPFNLKYLGIGNEQYGTYYTQYYEKFIEAFQAESNSIYSEVSLIVGNGMTFGDCAQPQSNGSMSTGTAEKAAIKACNKDIVENVVDYGVHDQHYYMNYLDFFTNTTVYDSYARPSTAPGDYYYVFVGEYSANSYTSGGDSYDKTSEWTNSWITALGEASMMTSYERNGDIVKLAAYAPMFASWEGTRRWQVDMMYFTNTQLVRSTNYYVQQLFMQNQGAWLIDSQTLTYADGFEPTYELESYTSSTATRSAEVNKLYYVASLNDDGDIVVKIVNSSADDIDMNIAITNARLKGTASVTVLSNESYLAVNSLEEEMISPSTYTIGGFTNKTVGYTVPAYSVTAIVIDVK